MPGETKPLVVIADDEADVLEAMRYQIEHWGCRAVAVTSKAELCRELARAEPDLLLLDLYFGAHNGIEVMQELLPRHPGLAVVLLTGNGAIDSAVVAIKRGAYDYLTKPPDMPRLRLLLNRIVEERRLRQRVQKLEQLVGHGARPRTLWG